MDLTFTIINFSKSSYFKCMNNQFSSYLNVKVIQDTFNRLATQL